MGVGTRRGDCGKYGNKGVDGEPSLDVGNRKENKRWLGCLIMGIKPGNTRNRGY